MDMDKEFDIDQSLEESLLSKDSVNEDINKPKDSTYIKIFKILGIIFLVAFLVILFWRYDYLRKLSTEFIEWADENPVRGTIYLFLIYVCVVCSFIPGFICATATGFIYTTLTKSWIYGCLIGLGVSWISSLTGAMIVQFLGRVLFRDFLTKCFEGSKRFQAFEHVLLNNDIRFLTLIRVTTIIPMNLCNYLVSITPVSYKNNAISMLGEFVPLIIETYIGSQISTASQFKHIQFSWKNFATTGSLIGLGLGLIIYMIMKMNKEIEKVMEDMETSRMLESDNEISSEIDEIQVDVLSKNTQESLLKIQEENNLNSEQSSVYNGEEHNNQKLFQIESKTNEKNDDEARQIELEKDDLALDIQNLYEEQTLKKGIQQEKSKQEQVIE